jgi:hypothetical protein
MPFRFQFAGHSVECASAATLPVRLVVDGVAIECDTLGEVMPAIELVSSLSKMNGAPPASIHGAAESRINGALNGAAKITKDMSRAAAIRAYLDDHKTASNTEVIDALRIVGFKDIQAQAISVQRSNLGLTKRKQKQRA